MNIYLVIILGILTANYILKLLIELLNISRANPVLPSEFQDYYDADKYKRSQNYLRENTYFSLTHDALLTAIFIVSILTGGFNFIDRLARVFNCGVVLTGLIFAVIIFLGLELIELPFSVYHTFVIEKKYGFNRTRIKTFIADILKSWMLALAIGGTIFSAVVWFFLNMGKSGWVWCWLGVSVAKIFIIFISPLMILPLFNKFTPLEEGETKEAIKKYAEAQGFRMKGIFTMDGSKRSSKSNAFFTGFGKYRRIVFFDTLLKQHPTEEIVAILAHEMGHYKKCHLLKSSIIGIFTNAVMFFILSLFIDNPQLFEAFKMQNISIYASIFFFSFLYAPINMVISMFALFASRKHEYEADHYAFTTYQKSEAFISALKKLTVNNLSNLTPHPLKVFLQYTHPPVLQRIAALRQMQSK